MVCALDGSFFAALRLPSVSAVPCCPVSGPRRAPSGRVCQEVHDLVIEVVAARVVSPLVASASTANRQFSTDTSNVPPPRSYTGILWDPCLVERPYARKLPGRLVDNSLYIGRQFCRHSFACFCASEKYAGTVITASVTFCPDNSHPPSALPESSPRNILRCMLLIRFVIVSPHVSLNGCVGSVRVGDSLSLCGHLPGLSPFFVNATTDRWFLRPLRWRLRSVLHPALQYSDVLLFPNRTNCCSFLYLPSP